MKKKFGDVETKKIKKLIKHGGGKGFTLRLPIERERNPRPGLNQTCAKPG
jgi:hypothetical protein